MDFLRWISCPATYSSIHCIVLNHLSDIITAPCEIDVLCYKGGLNIREYLNLPSSYTALSVPSAVGNFSVISEAISAAFELTADEGVNMIPEVQYFLASQIYILVYQGNLYGFLPLNICLFLGGEEEGSEEDARHVLYFF